MPSRLNNYGLLESKTYLLKMIMMIYKKKPVVLWTILLLIPTCLEATQMPDALDKQVPLQKACDIEADELAKDLSNLNLTAVKLPQDFHGYNLSNADLTGQHFTYTDFSDTLMEGVILTHTTCDYTQCYHDNLQKFRKESSNLWLFRKFSQDLKSIAQVYLFVDANSQKATLLQIASGLAYFPCCKGAELTIKMEYWSCKLFCLKKKIALLGNHLVCSLSIDIRYDKEKCCWQTDYPAHLEHKRGVQIASYWCVKKTKAFLPNVLGTLVQKYLIEPAQTLHDNFDLYLKLFQTGLDKYNVKAKEQWGYNFYRNAIQKNIQSLQKVYPQLASKVLKEEAMCIACELSESYKTQYLHFLILFLSCQNRLIKLKYLANLENGSDIYYSMSPYCFPLKV